MRRAATLPFFLVTVTGATGWLYLVHVALPGPRVGEALPLDELSRHASAPLLWFVLVWGAAALLVGLAARWARIGRTTGAIGFGVAAGLWSYLQSGVSIAVVRQIPMSAALDSADRLHAVYLSAAIVAVGVAALTVPRGRSTRAPFLVALVVAAGAGLDLLHAILPGDDGGLLRSLTPDAVGPLSRAAGVLAAVALLIASRGLVRRRRRAWQVAAVLSGFSTVLHVARGLDHGSLAAAVTLVVLLARRHDFDGPGDTSARRMVAYRLGTALTAIGGFALVALWVNRAAADQPFTARFALTEILRGLVGLHLRGSPHFAGTFGHWFPLALLLLGAASIVWVIGGWIAPWRHRVVQAEREREVARALVHAWGIDTLAPFVLRADKSYFFSPDESAFLAYRVVNGVAIVSGDPIGPRDRLADVVGAFVAHAHARDWRVAILGASEQALPLYTAHGLHALYHGDEAIVDTQSFSLDGRAIRKVRQSVVRLGRDGYTTQLLRPSELDGELRDELEHIARAWRGGQPERGFVMALDTLFGLGDDDALFVVGFDPRGRAAGFLHFAVSQASASLSLSSMPRLRATPNGFNEWLICETIAWSRTHGIRRVSLNFAPFAALLAPETDLNTMQELQRKALLALKGHFQLDNLLAFNRKFFPEFERRFVVYERRRDLPRVGLAALAAEAYLPFQSERK